MSQTDPGPSPTGVDFRAVTSTTARYTLLERLGHGATGTVHRAIEFGLESGEREVAIKRILPTFADNQRFLRGFVRAVQGASRLSHQNIAQIYKLGKGATGYFVSMELVRGPDIGRLWRRASDRRITPPTNIVVALMVQICEALEQIHEQPRRARTPIHGDLSPAHVLVDRTGVVKLIDVGLARACPRELQIARRSAYMSPEALDGDALHGGMDLFSTAAIGYEWLTMQRLRGATNGDEAAHRGAQLAPPSRCNRFVPPEFDALVMETLSADPAQRCSSAATMRQQLTSFATVPLSAAKDELGAWMRTMSIADGSGLSTLPSE